MKRIVKGAEPTELATWKAEGSSDGGRLDWSDLDGAPHVYGAMKRALFDEQGHLCCYCGRRIVYGDSHIEHFVPRTPRTGDPLLTFSWDNLLASCLANLQRGAPIHCGVKKGDWYDAALLVSPMDSACEARFRFELDGRIRAATDTDAAAAETIRRLDLDGPRLRALRKGAIEGLFALLDRDLEPEDYERLAQAYGQRGVDRKYEAFCFVRIAALALFCKAPVTAELPSEPG